MKKAKLPQTDSIRKLAEFWDAHDLTDFEDELEEVAKVRKKLAGRKLPAKRGRPATPQAKRAARKQERLKQKIGEPPARSPWSVL